ncbi:LacI family DNA-binding transcriptional regulator [Arthrobacter sp. 92]|uniref:LacI family DNA-binding transcriptional regulator n=1 Tax=Arthrobacter sp. 92 TaxID=3418175 RepID=UPI003CFBD317
MTMADVARAAGVSVTTVSHVLNKTRRVNPGTAAAVEEAIAATGYIPDQVARSIRTGGTMTIGCAVSAMSNPYFAEIVHGVESAAARAGYSLLLTDTHEDPQGQARAVATLLSRRVDAVILAPSHDPTATIDQVTGRGIPLVLIDRFFDAPVDQIGSENIEPTAKLVDHLAGLGHSRIGLVAGRDGVATTAERLEGFRVGMRRNKLRVARQLVASGANLEAYGVVQRFLALPNRPTALVVGSNRMTIGAMRAIRDAGLTVPDDIALVAFDDFEWADLFHPRLTVIGQATAEMGERAVGMVLSRLADPELEPRIERLPAVLVHRESCGCAEPV